MTEATNTTPPAEALSLDTFEGIRAARKNGQMPTQANFEIALKAQRQRVADLAVASAVASGEAYTDDRIDTPKESVPGKPKPYELKQESDRAWRHLSKLVYWYGKFQAGKFHELKLPPKYATAYAAPSPDDDYEPEEEEDEYEGADSE